MNQARTLRMEANVRHPAPKSVAPGKRIDSRELLGEGREIVIVHGGEEYRLRLTSQGKLILTK